jgi:hypothetical protein
LKFKLHVPCNTTKQVKDFIQASIVQSETLFNTVVATVTPGVSQHSPLTEISTQDFEGVAVLQEQRTITHFLIMENKTWMARIKKVLALPSCFFLSVAAPLYHEELDLFMPCSMILLIQHLDGVFGVPQVSLEWCHFQQHDVHRCLQTFL